MKSKAEKRKAWPCREPERLKRYMQRYRQENPHIIKAISRRQHLKIKFGITPGQYDEMFAAQQGLCAICGQPERTFMDGRKLAIDHDHKQNRIRGLLCFKCNRALGGLNDDISLLQRAIDYLKAHEDKNDATPVQSAEEQVVSNV
jgi:Recombination endonuclease VII